MHGLEQLVADPELQQVVGDQDVELAPAPVLPTQTCCQATQTTPLAPTRRETQSSPSRPAGAAVVGLVWTVRGDPRARAGTAVAGVAMSSAWCGRSVL